MANFRLAREAAISLGVLATSFAEEDDVEGMQISRMMGSATPHVSVSKKVRGGAITVAEERSIAGQLEEILPDSIPVFDPVIHLTLSPEDTKTIFIRSPMDYAKKGLVDF